MRRVFLAAIVQVSGMGPSAVAPVKAPEPVTIPEELPLTVKVFLTSDQVGASALAPSRRVKDVAFDSSVWRVTVAQFWSFVPL